MSERRLAGVKKTAQYLDISVNTLYSWSSQRKLVGYKLGGRLLKFDLNEIDQWLDRHRKDSNPKWEEVNG